MVTGLDRRQLLRALRDRRRQRGASILIVFLVIAMLMGIGMFAARSTNLSTSMAGSSRQLTQTRYITEYVTFDATASIARDPQGFLGLMPNYNAAPSERKCFGYAQLDNATCLARNYTELESEVGVPLVVPADVANKIPGGLGRADLQPRYNVDISELAPNSRPVPGEALNPEGAANPSKTSYYSITLTGTGQIMPASTLANLQKTLASSASVSTWRAHLTVGPLSKPAARKFVP